MRIAILEGNGRSNVGVGSYNEFFDACLDDRHYDS